jgi:hypothetical protein
MKNHLVNKHKIIEAFYLEPYSPDKDMPFGDDHGWRIVLITGYQSDGYPNKITIDKKSEKECIDFLDSLGFLKT